MQEDQDKERSTDQVQIEYKIIQKRNPGEDEIFRTRPERPWGPPSRPYNGYRVPFMGVKRQGLGANHPPHLAPRLKKE